MSALSALPATFSRQRGRLAIVCVIVAAAWFVVAFGEQAWRARELQAEVDQQHSAIVALDREHATLQAQVNRYATDAYFTYAAGRARRDLNLAKDGETLLLVHWGPPDTAAAARAPTPVPTPAPAQPNWRRWLELFGGK
jgi:cell division protein FtsB